jgi:hypothetical protein
MRKLDGNFARSLEFWFWFGLAANQRWNKLRVDRMKMIYDLVVAARCCCN